MRRVVVHGCGSIGMRHLRVLSSLPEVQVTASPRRPERCDELVAQGFRALPFAAALDEKPDGVVIATDTALHLEGARAALAAGAALLVEKPVTSTAAEARALIDAAGGRAVHVAYVLRFDPGLAFVRQHLPSLGRIVIADIECVSWLPGWRPGRNYLENYAARPDEGGVLRDLSHELDYAAWLLGPISAVAGAPSPTRILSMPDGVDESAALVARHGDRTLSTMRLSYAVHKASRVLGIVGEQATLVWSYFEKRATLLAPDGAERDSLTWSGVDAMYEGQARAWVNALGGAGDERLCTLAEAAATVAVCDRVRAGALLPIHD